MAGLKPYTHSDVLQLLERAKPRYDRLNARRQLERQILATGSLQKLAESQGLAENTAADLLRRVARVEPNRINLLLPAITLLHASLLPETIQHNVEARSGGEHGDNLATIAGAKLDDLWYRTGMEPLQRAAMDYVTIGECWGKVTYHLDERERATTADEQQAHYAQLLDAATDVAVADGAKPSDLVSHADLEDQLELTTTEIVSEGVALTYIDATDIRVDEHATGLKDARWLAQYIVLPYDEVLANPHYDKKVKVLPNGELSGRGLTHAGRVALDDPHSGSSEGVHLTCELIEFYDQRTRKVMVLQEGGEAPLLHEDWPYEYDGLPFAHAVMYREKPSDFHGFGEIRNIASLQQLHSDTIAKQVENAELAAAHKYFVSTGLELTDDARDAMEDPTPGLAVIVDTNQQDIRNFILPWQPNQLSSDVYQMAQTAEEGITKGLGLNEFQQGSALTSHVSGTAAAVADGTATTRLQPKVYDLQAFAADLSRIGLSMIREFEFAEDRVAEEAGEEPPGRPLHIRTPFGAKQAQIYGWMLDGDFDVKVTSSSSGKNAASKKQDGLDLVTSVIPTLTQLQPDLDTTVLVKHAMSLLQLDPQVYFKLREQLPAPAGVPTAAGLPAEGQLPAPPADLGPQTAVGGMAASAQLDGGIAL